MITKLLISSSLATREEEIKKILAKNEFTDAHPDLLYLDDDQKLGVEQAKKIREFLSLKPYSASVRAIVVISSHNFTLDAQNSLLKTLEEPPAASLIILGAESEERFLPTILSRCEIVTLTELKDQEIENKYADQIEKLIKISPEERFNFIEKLEDKQAFLKSLVQYFRNHLVESKKVAFTKKLLAAEKWQKSSGNIRAILEYLMLEL